MIRATEKPNAKRRLVPHFDIVLFCFYFFIVNSVFAQEDQSNEEEYQIEYEDLGIPVDAIWIVDPRNHGTNIPTIGRSLFDRLFVKHSGDSHEYHIPFPFSQLLAFIDESISLGPDGGIHKTMIPLGRSLQKNAAAPDFFKYPRIVVSIGGEPRSDELTAGLHLKDMLFLGYQEKANSVEIISYNDQAARFEFQVINNYGPGMEPEVSYANRQLCMSCHQNAGPIFADRPWNETDANLVLAEKIELAIPGFKFKKVRERRRETAWQIFRSSYLANYYSAYQFIWQQGCGKSAAVSQNESVRCRAALLKSIVKNLITGSGYNDTDSTEYLKAYFEIVSRNWKQEWPDGLLVANATIPDVNPAADKFDPASDPLHARPPQAVWAKPNHVVLDGAIPWLGKFLTIDDIRRIDERLITLSKNIPVRQSLYNGDCEFSGNAMDKGHIEFSCKAVSNPGLSMFGILWPEPETDSFRGNIRWLSTGDFPDLRLMQIRTVGQDAENRAHTFSLKAFGSNMNHVRNQQGHRLDKVEIRFDTETTGKATLIVSQDFDPLFAAIDDMSDKNIRGEGVSLSGVPFQRQAIVSELNRSLGITPLEWCCDSIEEFPEMKIPELATISGETEYHHISKHCATCHSSDTDVPPGFLFGSTERIREQLAKCAPRMYYRASLWAQAGAGPTVSPMPPVHHINAVGLDENEWMSSMEFSNLVTELQRLNEKHSQPYDPSYKILDITSLPEC